MTIVTPRSAGRVRSARFEEMPTPNLALRTPNSDLGTQVNVHISKVYCAFAT